MSLRPLVTFGRIVALLIVLSSCGQAKDDEAAAADSGHGKAFAKAPVVPPGDAVATFAGGCFWCMEPPFEKLDGVVSVTSGYAGGREANPTYEQVSYGLTGHAESVQIVYDPKRIGYERLLDVYWHNTDPTSSGGQFCDRGSQYRPIIFYHDATQKRLAEASKARIESGPRRFSQPVVTRLEPLRAFYPAEEYHQDFARKEPIRYQAYRLGCGRDRRLEELWGKAAAASH